MIKINDELLQELGLAALPPAEKDGLLKHIYETLEMRVGMRLADQMSNEQLDEFERYFEAKDDAGAFKWLETNFPNYKDIVQEEFDKLKAEVGQSAPQILAASQAQAAQAPQAVPAPAPSPALTTPAATAAPGPVAPAVSPVPPTPMPLPPQPPASPQPAPPPAPAPAPSPAPRPQPYMPGPGPSSPIGPPPSDPTQPPQPPAGPGAAWPPQAA